MRHFVDSAGRTRDFTIAYQDVVRVRDRLEGADLLRPHEASPDGITVAKRVAVDDVFLVDLLFVLCGGDDNPVAFGRAMRGCVVQARLAVFDAWQDFFPVPDPDDEEEKATKPVDLDQFMWEMAGVVGVHPGPFTMRQICWMSRGKSREAWKHTASLLAMIVNVNRDAKRSRPVAPRDFDPYAVKPKLRRVSMRDLFQMTTGATLTN